MLAKLRKNLPTLLLVGVGFSAPFFFSKRSSTSNIRTPPHFLEYEKKEIKLPTLSQISPQSLVKEISLKYQNGLLTVRSIQEIWKKSIELIRGDFIEETIRSRKDRRKVFSQDQEKYLGLVADFIAKNEKMIEKADDDLLLALHVPRDLLSKSVEVAFTSQNFEPLIMVLVGRRYHLKY